MINSIWITLLLYWYYLYSLKDSTFLSKTPGWRTDLEDECSVRKYKEWTNKILLTSYDKTIHFYFTVLCWRKMTLAGIIKNDDWKMRHMNTGRSWQGSLLLQKCVGTQKVHTKKKRPSIFIPIAGDVPVPFPLVRGGHTFFLVC